ncbi:MAG: hypothetical protein JKY09_02055 [Crocinitomicaceae bacterium]|nr:hypothetical protein [Crocinitomicaceae bacterium]
MKKALFILSIITSLSTNTSAQVNPHAIGVRLGGGSFGSGAEISYQHGLGEANRLEIDLGWSTYKANNGFGKDSYKHYTHTFLTGIYHWDWNLVSSLNWYVGPGAQLGFYQDRYDDNNDGITLSLGGQIGIEYDFNELGAPILLALDMRPMWGFLGGTSGAGYGAALSVRYIF